LSTENSAARSKPWYAHLYLQVLIAICIGILVGHFFPKTGTALKLWATPSLRSFA